MVGHSSILAYFLAQSPTVQLQDAAEGEAATVVQLQVLLS